ncbi:unnamed protein product, partial [Pylaiella littoralis]
EFLIHPDTRKLLDSKLPPGSEHRALLNVLSGTMVRIIDKIQFDRVTMGESPDLELSATQH